MRGWREVHNVQCGGDGGERYRREMVERGTGGIVCRDGRR